MKTVKPEDFILKTDNETVQILADMRFISNSIGQVYPEQLRQLKLLANLVFSPAVAEVSLSTEIKAAMVKTTGTSTPVTAKFEPILKEILGDTWNVSITYGWVPPNVKPAKSSRKRPASKPSRKKRR